MLTNGSHCPINYDWFVMECYIDAKHRRKMCIRDRYIPTVYRAYEIIFDMLKSKDSRCHSLDIYTLMLSNLEYYPFLDYKLACERNREDQSK